MFHPIGSFPLVWNMFLDVAPIYDSRYTREILSDTPPWKRISDDMRFALGALQAFCKWPSWDNDMTSETFWPITDRMFFQPRCWQSCRGSFQNHQLSQCSDFAVGWLTRNLLTRSPWTLLNRLPWRFYIFGNSPCSAKAELFARSVLEACISELFDKTGTLVPVTDVSS